MLFHVSPSHYSLAWPCHFLWVWHPRFPPSPAHILAHLPVCHSNRVQRARNMPASQCPSPLPQVAQPGVAGLSAVPKPGSSLSYKSERTWKLKQEKPRAGARGLLGQLGERQPRQSDHIIYWCSLGRHIWLGKEPLHITRHSLALSWPAGTPQKLLKDKCLAWEVPNDGL